MFQHTAKFDMDFNFHKGHQQRYLSTVRVTAAVCYRLWAGVRHYTSKIPPLYEFGVGLQSLALPASHSQLPKVISLALLAEPCDFIKQSPSTTLCDLYGPLFVNIYESSLPSSFEVVSSYMP